MTIYSALSRGKCTGTGRVSQSLDWVIFFFFKFYLFIYFWLCWVFVAVRRQAFSSCVEWGLLFVAVRGLLIAVASLVAEHGL